MKRKKNTYIPKITAIKSRLAQLLLGVFLLANVPSITFHALIHQHHEAENIAFHSVENENDACHRRVYHHDIAKGCEHKSHINTEKKECDWCKVFPINDVFILAENTFIFSHFQANFTLKTSKITFFSYTYLSNPPSRGPPVETNYLVA